MTERFEYRTAGGVVVERTTTVLPYDGAIEPVIDALDSQRGVLLASNFEFPGRYTRWDLGFVDPPLAFTATGRAFTVEALNARGEVLLPPILAALEATEAVESVGRAGERVDGTVKAPARLLAEEERSKQHSTFSIVRALRDVFAAPDDGYLGLYGSFGYDLALQFQRVDLHLPRPEDHRDVVLYVPDSLVVVDHARGHAVRHDYEFEVWEPTGAEARESSGGEPGIPASSERAIEIPGAPGAATRGRRGVSTRGLARATVGVPFVGETEVAQSRDMEAGGYAQLTKKAQESFAVGDLFEVVPSQVFREPCPAPPSELFRRLRERNPAPYGGLLNLGADEWKVSASPEMFVRVDGTRVESCPISGTIARGDDVLSDAEQIATLLASKKDEAELTMCTDVDRNDKSRVCEPGSVEVIGRRQIEMYSRLIHTVDHVEGTLRPEFDALDAFLTHTWAVTVTGAPKLWAMRFIEQHERSPRAWYGGAFGLVGFDGNLNTGLTLRTIRIKAGVAEVRVGATLLADSDPVAEEAETELKASALLDAIRRPRDEQADHVITARAPGSAGRLLLIDHEDSFVHTLANYFRQAGSEVLTVRVGFTPDELRKLVREFEPRIVCLSPGPGEPDDFAIRATIDVALDEGVAVFGVCLGLQGIVEYYGGTLGVLDEPMHGKPSEILVRGGRIFEGLPASFTAGRYHSLYADKATLPTDVLTVTAESDDGVVMAIEHVDRPLAAVQFHPESIMSLKGDVGPRLIRNVVDRLPGRTR